MNWIIDHIRLFTNTANQEITTSLAVAIENGAIAAIAPAEELRRQFPDARKMDGQGKLLMPGWINTHMHLYSTFARGWALKTNPFGFQEILQQLWWQLDKALDEESVYLSALIPAITSVKNGVTSIIDHHASPNAIDGSLDRIQEALKMLGLRAVLCYEVSDRDGREQAKAGLRENERFIIKQKKESSMYEGMIGLHAAFTLSDEMLEAAADLGQRTNKGFHIHLSEGLADDSRPEYGLSTTERLQQHGILGPRTLAAHAIHISQTDRTILKESETMVAHNPQSNMNNAVGRADIFALLEQDILVGLGTDGMSASLYGDMRAANLIHKHDLQDNRVGWNEVQKMVLKNNAQIYQRVSGLQAGHIAPGLPADLILIDYFPPTPMTNANIWGHVLFGIADAPVDTVFIGGERVLFQKQLINIDEAEAAAKARELTKKVWAKM